jgi:integrase
MTRGEGSIYQPRYRDRHGELKTAATWWIRYSHRGKLYREPSESTDEAVARRLLRKRLEEKERTGRVIGPTIERTTLADLTTMVLHDYRVNGRRIRVIKAPLQHLVDYFGEGCRTLDITPDRITAYIAQRLDAGASPATINRSLAALKRGFHLAAKAGKVIVRPEMDMLREHNERKGFFEFEQYEILLEHCAAYLKPVVQTAYITGWRIASEILTRQKHHVDLEAGWLRLEPNETKNHDGRMFPLTPELREVIEQQFARTRELELATGQIVQWLFHHDGEPIRVFRRAWVTACKKAGLPGRIPHDFRRTAVRNLERAGVPRSSAMAMTGHKTESIYKRYAIVDEAMLREGADKLAVLHRAEASSERKVIALRPAKTVK